MVVLGLRFCARAFSSCDKRGPLFIAVRGPLTIAASCCGAQAPDAQAQQLWVTGPVAPRHVGSSQTRARTHVPCIGRQILNHCATREAPPGCKILQDFWTQELSHVRDRTILCHALEFSVLFYLSYSIPNPSVFQ